MHIIFQQQYFQLIPDRGIIVIIPHFLLISTTIITIIIVIMSKSVFQSIAGGGEGVGRGCTRGGHGDLLHLCHDHDDHGEHSNDDDGDYDDTDFVCIMIKIMKLWVTQMI